MGIKFNTIYLIIQFIIVACLVAAIILNNLKVHHNPTADHLAFDIRSNWKLHPIMDIVAEESGACPKEYEPIIFDVWNGTSEGCDCTSITASDIPSERGNQVTKGKCSFEMAVAQCDYISSRSEINLTKWRGTSLCVKYFNRTYENIMKNELASERRPCKDTEKFCGIVDTFGNKLCLKKEEECPLNKIIFQEQIPEGYTFKAIPLSKGFNLYFTNQAVNSTLLVEIKISEGLVCLDSTQKGSSMKQYPLLKDYDYYGCSSKIENHTDDTRYISLDSYTKRDFYTDNDLMHVVSSLPRYDLTTLDTNMLIYFRPYIGFNPEFLRAGAINPDEISDALASFKTVYQVLNIVTGLATFFSFFLIVGKLDNLSKNYDLLWGLELFLSVVDISVVTISAIDYVNFGYSAHEISKYVLGDPLTNNILLDMIYREIATMRTFRIITCCLAAFAAVCSPFSLMVHFVVKYFTTPPKVPVSSFKELEMTDEIENEKINII